MKHCQRGNVCGCVHVYVQVGQVGAGSYKAVYVSVYVRDSGM